MHGWNMAISEAASNDYKTQANILNILNISKSIIFVMENILLWGLYTESSHIFQNFGS